MRIVMFSLSHSVSASQTPLWGFFCLFLLVRQDVDLHYANSPLHGASRAPIAARGTKHRRRKTFAT